MPQKSSKVAPVLVILGMGLLNLFIDWRFMKGMAALDVIFYVLVLLAVLFGRKVRRDSPGQKSTDLQGYTGPFWNKPSPAYLEARARESTTDPSLFAPFLLLIPFAVLFYLLLRH